MNTRISLAITGMLLMLSSQVANAIPVTVFYDNSFVDTSTEAANMTSQLGALGHSTTLFSGTSDADWSSALGSTGALVIPELENGNLSGSLSAATKSSVSSFVSGGGNLVVAGSHTAYGLDLLNSIFGWSLIGTTHSFSSSSLTAAAAGTDFAAGPASLDGLNATWHITGGIPAGATSIYSDSTGTTVMNTAIGLGNVTFLAYDWFATASNAGWGSVLDTAVTQGASSVPEPNIIVLLATGLVSFGLARRRKMKA